MAFACGTLTVTTGTAGTTFTVSGLAFAPQAIVLFTCGRATAGQAEGDIKWSMGFATSTTSRRSYATQSDHAATTAATDSYWRNDACIVTLTTTGGVDGLLDVSSFTSDGFVLIVDDAFAVAQQLGWVAYGGLDNVSITDLTQPGSTGNQDINVGFALNTGQDDKALIVIGNPPVNASTANTDSPFCFGIAALDTPVGAILTGSSVDPSDPTITCAYCRTGESFGLAYNDLVVARGTVTTWLSTGFRINWAEIAGGTGRYSVLAMQGSGVRFFAGDGTTATDTSNHQEATPYQPTGILIGSAGRAVSTSDTTSATDERIVGATDGTNQWSASAIDKDAQGTADCGAAYSTTAFYVNQSAAAAIATEGAMAIVSLDSTPGFTYAMTDADPSAAYFFYLGIADGTSPITGSIALTLDPTGTLTGSGALAGTVALTVTPTGALTGAGALTGSISLSLTPTGDLTSAAAFEGVIPLSLAVVGSLTGTGDLTGAIPLTLTPSGALTGSGALAGSIPLTLTPTGSLSGSGALASTIPLTLAPTGSLTGTGALSGTLALALDLTGTLAGLSAGEMAGNVPLALLTSGVLTGTGGLLGSLSFSFDLTGAMTGTGELSGLVDLTLTPTGTLTDASAARAPTSEAFSGGFLFAYEQEQARRRRRKREREELEEQARQLQDEVDREIALLLHQQQAEKDRQAELDRLQALVKAHSHAQLQLSDRAKIAYVRALTQSNFSAMQALERELERMIFEEEAAAVMFLLNED